MGEGLGLTDPPALPGPTTDLSGLNLQRRSDAKGT